MGDSVKVENFMPNICSTFGEGPHWEESTERLLFIDMRVNEVHRLNVKTKVDEKIVLGDRGVLVGMIVPCSAGGFIVTQERKICHLDWETKTLSDIAEIPKLSGKNELNDAKCDSNGRLWIGSAGGIDKELNAVEGDGRLFSLEKGRLSEKLGPFNLSNGMGWSRDNKVMYFVDSLPHRKIYALDYDAATGSVSNKRVFVDFERWSMEEAGFPDGMCTDVDGNLWVAGFHSSKVMQFNASTGKMMRSVQIPAKCVTSCCFGGKDYSDLYVTTAVWAGYADDPHAGSLFKVTGLGVRGVPANSYMM